MKYVNPDACQFKNGNYKTLFGKSMGKSEEQMRDLMLIFLGVRMAL